MCVCAGSGEIVPSECKWEVFHSNVVVVLLKADAFKHLWEITACTSELTEASASASPSIDAGSGDVNTSDDTTSRDGAAGAAEGGGAVGGLSKRKLEDDDMIPETFDNSVMWELD